MANARASTEYSENEICHSIIIIGDFNPQAPANFLYIIFGCNFQNLLKYSREIPESVVV